MKLNPFKSLDPDFTQDDKDSSKYDESVLQQGRFWMRTVTWTLIGTTVFGIAWLAIARTEEIVVATGQLEPVGSVQDIQMPVGGVVDDILVEEGDTVKKGEILMKLDTEASEQQRQSLEASIRLKGVERNKYSEMKDAEIQMLENNLVLHL
jgi:HlyD family secretion protein